MVNIRCHCCGFFIKTSKTMAKKIPQQPTEEQQRELKDIVSEKASYVYVRGKRWKVKPPRLGNFDLISREMLEKNDTEYKNDPVKSGEKENKVICKCVAYLRLNTRFKIMLLHWIVWRWMYYIKEYEPQELVEYIEECKKKAPVEQYLIATILLTEMMDTKMQMSRTEVNRIQAEHLMAQHSTAERTTKN